MSVPVENRAIYKGQDKSVAIYIADETGMKTLTSCRLVFSMRETVDGTPVITKDSDVGGEIDIDADQVNNEGEAVVNFVPADTSSLDSKRYYYDLWLTDSVAKTYPVLTGYFNISDVAPTMLPQIRHLLDEAGELRVMTVKDEMADPSTALSLYTARKRVKEVYGVWTLSDDEHTGTNYYTGGGFNTVSGRIWLGTPLVDMNTVRIDYAWESGIDDDAINWHLTTSKIFVTGYTGIEFDYGKAITDLQKQAEGMALARIIIGCVLTINGANVAQMGYNFRLDEFEIQTKLWGEGMIAEALFAQYSNMYNEWKLAIGKKGHIFFTAPTTRKYDISTLVGYTADGPETSER